MAIDLATLAALGILPSGGMALPDASQQLLSQPGQSLFPVQADGTDPLAPLPDAPSADSGSSEGKTGSFGQPWRSDALLALGAGLLSGRNFFDGLAKGAMAAQQARGAYENPKRDLIANGAFTLEQYPDGSTKLVPNKGVQDYQTLQTEIGYEGKAALAAQNAQAIAERMAANNKAELDRTQAMIAAQNDRFNRKLASDERYHTQDLKVREEGITGKETPYQKAVDTKEAQEAVDLPDQISQNKSFSDDLAWLMDPSNYKSFGLGVGTAKKGERALATVLPSTGSLVGIDPNKQRQAKQILSHIKMIATRQWLKGTGSRITNYDLKLATDAQPSLDMDPTTFLRAVSEIKRINDEGIQNDQAKLQRLIDDTNKRGSGGIAATGGVTSGGIHWKPVD